MDSSLLIQLEQLLERNRALRELAAQEGWETFADEVEAYAAQLKCLAGRDFNVLEPTLRERARVLLDALIAQDAHLKLCIQARLNGLSGEMSALRNTRRTAHAYTAV